MRLTLLVLVLLAAGPLSGASFSLDFNEYPFPTDNTVLLNTVSSNPATAILPLNLLNDITGAELLADNGDLPEVFIALDARQLNQGSVRIEWQPTSSGRISIVQEFTSARTDFGNVAFNLGSVEVRFSPRLRASNAMASFLSLNTAGTSWEGSRTGYFRPNGSFFSTGPLFEPYDTAISRSGNTHVGWYTEASKLTVTGVGTSQTSPGVSGPANNLNLTQELAGLTASTLVGGIRWGTLLQDVRGPLNGGASFSASMTGLSFDYQLQIVPEPDGAGLLAGGLAMLLAWRRRR